MTADIVSLSSSKETISLQTKVEAYQRLSREWIMHLSANEAVVLQVILDRTIGWGRREAYWTTRAMLKGDDVYGGMSLSRPTLFRCLARLESMGLIARRSSPAVPDRTHYSVNLNWKHGIPSVPRPLRVQSHNDTAPSHGETAPSHCETLYTISTKQDELNGNLAPADAVALVVPEARFRARRTEEPTCEETATEKPNVTEAAQTVAATVEAAWRAALTETFPGNAERAWTNREKSQAKMTARNWLGARTVTFTDFVDWSVRNWTAIMRKQFKWMTKSPPPTVPAWGFFVAMIGQFAECHAEHKLEDWLSSADRTEIERMMARGQTWEQATKTLAENKTAKALRGEMEKREREATTRERAADMKMQRAEKLAEFAGNTPIHPRSPAARKRIAAEGLQVTKIAIPADEIGKGVSVYMVNPENGPFD